MNLIDRIKEKIIGTPFESVAMWLRDSIPSRHPRVIMEKEERRAIDAILKRGIKEDANCIDVGAHLGLFVSLFCKLAPKGTHHAFEPIPEKAKCLKEKFPGIKIHQTALSDKPGEVEFAHIINRSGFSSFVVPPNQNDTVNYIKVPTARLDDVIQGDTTIDFIKIDVEGAELLVLQGAVHTLNKSAPLLLFECSDYHDMNLRREKIEGLYKLLVSECGYDIYTPQGFLDKTAPLSIEELIKAPVYPPKAYNFIGSKRLNK